MAGDNGFDPLGFAKTSSDLNNMREAEIKHARLAMLAAAGWPLSELFDKKIANTLGMVPVLDDAGRVPSVLNGGMGKISPIYWGFCLLLAAAIDVNGSFRTSKDKGYFPGKLGFDPFGLYPKDAAGQKWMQTAEIKNGRVAMIAITAFAAQEFVSHTAIVDQVPFLFKPIWQTLSDSANNGYVVPPGDISPVGDILPLDIPPVETPSVTAPPVDNIFESFSIPSESASTIAPSVDPVPPVSSASPPVDNEELIAAKKRIAELESKLAAVSDLIR